MWSTIWAHMLTNFVPSDYARRAQKSLANCHMGKHNITAYIDDFRRLLVCCTDVQESEAKFLFKNNMADWLASYILPYNCPNLRETMLCAEQYRGNKFTSSSIRHLQYYSSSSNYTAAPAQALFQWSWESLQGSALGMAKQATNVQIVVWTSISWRKMAEVRRQNSREAGWIALNAAMQLQAKNLWRS